MKRVLIPTLLTAFVLGSNAHAATETHRVKIPAHSVTKWRLDHRYPKTVELYPTSARRDPSGVYERGQCPGPSDVADTLGWTFDNGVLLEATQPGCEAGPIRFRASNLRDHARWVRIRVVSPITG